MTAEKTCKWHLCGATFTPGRRSQEFCSSKCQKDRANWKRIRGSALVDPLINGHWKELRDLRAELIEEESK